MTATERLITAGEAASGADLESGGPKDHGPPVAHPVLTDAEWSRCRSVVDVFETIAQAHPSPIALRQGERSVTYAELNAWAQNLALRLQRSGVESGDRVVIALSRSVEQIGSALAVMKSGAAFIPLDPSAPPSRLRDLIEDADPSVVIGRGERAAEICGHLPVLDLDRPDARREADELLPGPSPDDLAYIIYTSGSTGRPKGVEITHAALLNFVAWRWRSMAVGTDDRSSHLASVDFDASIAEVWPHLTAGASVTLAPDDVKTTPERLKAWLVREQITLATFVPPVLASSMIRSGWPRETALRILMSAGEAIRTYPAPNAPFVFMNGYGPTEGTVETTVAVVAPDPSCQTPPPIGRPITGVRVHLLDEDLRPVAAGHVGEIHISGANLARGYWRRPELTAERFITASTELGGDLRLYRTGDLARVQTDGQLVFCGRKDDQVKIRGHRIEPGEVAAVLSRHPAVEAATVIAEGDDPDVRLLACAAPKRDAVLTEQGVRAFLAGEIPDYMSPSRVVIVPELPLTSNGKVDRTALLQGRTGSLTSDEAVCSEPVQDSLLRIWSEALSRPVRLDDDVFDLGADSLVAVNAMLAIEARLRTRISLAMLFDAPTVRAMTPILESAAVERLAPRLTGGGRGDSHSPLVWLQVRPEFYRLATAIASRRSFTGLVTEYDANPGLSECHTLPEIAAYFAERILATCASPPRVIGGYSDFGVLALEVARRLGQSTPPTRVVMVDSYHPAAVAARGQLRSQLLRARHHWRALAGRHGNERWAYVTSTLQARLRTSEYSSRRSQARSALGEGETLTNRLRLAVAAHEPATYEGEVVLLQAAERSRAALDLEHWRATVKGPLKAFTSPGDHRTMIQPPHVDRLVDLLDRHLP